MRFRAASDPSRLLLLMPATTYRASDFMAAAHGLPIEVIVGCDRAQAADLFSEGRTQPFDFSDPNAGAKQIVDFAAAFPIDAIVPVDDQAVELAAAAATRLGLSHNPTDAVRMTRDKFHLRECLDRAGLSDISFRQVPLDGDVQTIAGDIRYPAVLKPLNLSASRGVCRIDDELEFVREFAALSDLVRAERGDAVLIEDYVEGAEVSFEGLLHDGQLHQLALFDKPDPLTGPYFEETIYVTPSRLEEETQQAIFQAVEGAVQAIGLHHGPIHAELRLAPTGPWIIEIAARSIGGLCGRILQFATGLSLEDVIVRHALGRTDFTTERDGAAAAVMMIPIPRSGRLHAVHELEAAKSIDAIDDIVITIPIGGTVTAWPEGHNYLGFIFARAEHPETAESALRDAHNRLDFDIRNPD